MDLNLFRTFEVIFRERNLTRAAAVLHVSQSAVSHSLARLREQLGDPLFIRQGRGVIPTAFAARLAADIFDSLEHLQHSVNRLKHFNPTTDNHTFYLNMPEQLEPVLLPRILIHLRRVAPSARVQVSSVRWAELTLELAARRIDLSIEIARPVSGDLRQQQLTRKKLCVVTSKNFQGDLDSQSYIQAEHIAVTSRRRGLSYEDLALGYLGVTRNVVYRCQSYLSASLLVAETNLLLTMSEHVASLVNKGLHTRLLPMPLPLPPAELNMYWHESLENDPANQWLREQLITLAQSDFN